MEFRCPKCKEKLIREGKSYRCMKSHTYDIAKSGYTNLLLGNHKLSGDNKEMVHARTMFLSHGYYAFLKQRLCEIVGQLNVHTIVDAGCGEGYYTNACKEQLMDSEFYGFDLSKFALQQAAKAKNGVQYAVASVADLPLADESAELIISVFAPIYIEEYKRILKENGWFLKVEPGPKHLYEMKQVLYDEIYENEADAQTYEGMRLMHEELLETNALIQNQEDLQALFQMTPYYYRSPKAGVQRLLALTNLETRLQFHIELYQKVQEI